jgi:CelD/BcsL family acetyltransferase involved in cellulose biosynthesis
MVQRQLSIEGLDGEWDELADRARAHPFLRPGWTRAWLDAFARDPLEVLTLRRGSRLAAVLPLVRRRGALCSPTNWHTPLGGVLGEDLDARLEIVAAALALRPRRLSLDFLDLVSPGRGALLEAATRARFAVHEETMQRSPTLPLHGDWEAYLAGRSAKRSKEIARQRSRLNQRGDLTFEVETGIDRLEEGLQVEGSGWKVAQGTAILSQPHTARLYRQVAAWAARRGMLRLFFLRLDGRPIAFEYAILDNRVLYDLKGGYDPEFRSHAPGLLIAREMLEWSFRQGLSRFELLGRVETQKLHWTKEVRDLQRVRAFAPTPGGRIEQFVVERVRPLARRVKARLRGRES